MQVCLWHSGLPLLVFVNLLHENMASQESVQALFKARAKALKAASESRNIDELMTWYTKNAVFEDPGNACAPTLTRSCSCVMAVDARKVVGAEAQREMYGGTYKSHPPVRGY